jgi:hypothetical protein
VKSIDKKVVSQISRLGLGSRLTESDGVKSVLESIFKLQGKVIIGPIDSAFSTIINDVTRTVTK